jgi:hypothetical protein
MQGAGKRQMALNTFKHFQLKEGREAGACWMACNTFLDTLNNISQEYFEEGDQPGDETSSSTRWARLQELVVGLQGGPGGPKWVGLTSPVIRLGNGPGQHSRKIVSTASRPQPYVYVLLQTATARSTPEQGDFRFGSRQLHQVDCASAGQAIRRERNSHRVGKSRERHRAKATLARGVFSAPEAEFEPRSRTPGRLLVLIVC